jgi:hypothetical protein
VPDGTKVGLWVLSAYSGNRRELWVTITGNFTGFFFKALSGNPQLQIGVFADTALVIY